MIPIIRCVGISLLVLAGVSAAAKPPFTGAFSAWSRGCAGSLYVRNKTIEWITPWSICKSSPYEVLDRSAPGEPMRIVFQIKRRSKTCRYEVVELMYSYDNLAATWGAVWNATGYQSLEAYRKREDPEWKNSPLPKRNILNCPMEQKVPRQKAAEQIWHSDGVSFAYMSSARTQADLRSVHTDAAPPIDISSASAQAGSDIVMNMISPFTVQRITGDLAMLVRLISLSGDGIFVLRFTGVNPTHKVSLMVDKLTADLVHAGFQRTTQPVTRKLADGTVLTGTLVHTERVNSYHTDREVLAIGNTSGGYLVISQTNDSLQNLPMAQRFWRTLHLDMAAH